MSILFEIITIILFGIVGGTIRWSLFRKEPLKRYIIEDPYYNSIPVTIIIIPTLLVKSFY